ncbi:uncharacterized protein RHOBADRAFT_52584, partial [Rhodotorula graminis WP1]
GPARCVRGPPCRRRLVARPTCVPLRPRPRGRRSPRPHRHRHPRARRDRPPSSDRARPALGRHPPPSSRLTRPRTRLLDKGRVRLDPRPALGLDLCPPQRPPTLGRPRQGHPGLARLARPPQGRPRRPAPPQQLGRAPAQACEDGEASERRLERRRRRATRRRRRPALGPRVGRRRASSPCRQACPRPAAQHGRRLPPLAARHLCALALASRPPERSLVRPRPRRRPRASRRPRPSGARSALHRRRARRASRRAGGWHRRGERRGEGDGCRRHVREHLAPARRPYGLAHHGRHHLAVAVAQAARVDGRPAEPRAALGRRHDEYRNRRPPHFAIRLVARLAPDVVRLAVARPARRALPLARLCRQVDVRRRRHRGGRARVHVRQTVAEVEGRARAQQSAHRPDRHGPSLDRAQARVCRRARAPLPPSPDPRLAPASRPRRRTRPQCPPLDLERSTDERARLHGHDRGAAQAADLPRLALVLVRRTTRRRRPGLERRRRLGRLLRRSGRSGVCLAGAPGPVGRRRRPVLRRRARPEHGPYGELVLSRRRRSTRCRRRRRSRSSSSARLGGDARQVAPARGAVPAPRGLLCGAQPAQERRAHVCARRRDRGGRAQGQEGQAQGRRGQGRWEGQPKEERSGAERRQAVRARAPRRPVRRRPRQPPRVRARDAGRPRARAGARPAAPVDARECPGQGARRRQAAVRDRARRGRGARGEPRVEGVEGAARRRRRLDGALRTRTVRATSSL